MTNTQLALMLSNLVCTERFLPMWDDGQAIITDGCIAFLIDDVNQPIHWALWGGQCWANPQGESRIKRSPAELRQMLSIQNNSCKPLDFELPVIEPRESWLNPNEVVTSTCDECNGSGEVICNYHHDHECEDCDGTGKVSHTRIDADWFATPSNSRVIGTSLGSFDKRYLWFVGQLAKQRQLTYLDWPAIELGFGLLFEGGNGLLMGVKTRKV